MSHIDVSKQVKLVRWGARRMQHLPYAPQTVVEACLWIELAGMPSRYRLSTTASEYFVVENCVHVIVLLATRVGNPRISPVPPIWPVLALLLVGWRDVIPVEAIMDRAVELGVVDDVQRGFAMLGYLFPELQGWLRGISWRIPLWERVLAVPFAARKLVLWENLG